MTPFSQKVFSFLDVSLRQDLNGGEKSTKWSKFVRKVSVSESPFLNYRQDKLDLEQQPERETEVEGQVLCRTQKVKRQDLQVNWKGLFFFVFVLEKTMDALKVASVRITYLDDPHVVWTGCLSADAVAVKVPESLVSNHLVFINSQRASFGKAGNYTDSVCYPFSKWASTTSNHWDEHRTVLVISNEMSVCAILSLWGTL